MTPDLPQIHLHDTATGSVRPLELREPGVVSIYCCGPTVYAPPHLGHGRFVLVYDVLRRYLEWAGYEVRFVSNITDIDDKIIERAQNEDRAWQQITQRCEKVWFDTMDRIDVMRPTETPHATEYVDQMVELISTLIGRDAAYTTDDGVYLAVEGIEGYGLLARQSLDQLVEGGGDREVFGADAKRHPADFALWKFSKPGEPAWPSPWGEGRPGWHTECVVMSLDLLGEGFDLHTGGLDLAFPHHENERAQAVALGAEFAKHWMHNGFVEMDGEKMSKSIGNVKNLVDLADRHDPRAYRLLVLQSHYRSPIEVTDTSIANAEAALGRLDTFARRTSDLDGAADTGVLDAFRTAMANDLDTPAGMQFVFNAVRDANSALDAGDTEAAATAAATARELCGALGLRLEDAAAAVPAEIEALVAERTEARAAKDWARADAIRDELSAAGWTVEDSADGPVARPL